MTSLSTTPAPEPSSHPRAKRRVARAVPVAAVLAGALLLAGCGGDDDKQEPPATPAAAASFNVTSELAPAVPADAAVFAEVKLQPGGEQQAAIDELTKLFDDGKGTSLAEELDLDLKGGRTFEKDIVPYLGGRAGGFAIVDPEAPKTTSTKDDEADGALIVQVKDKDKLTESLTSSFGASTKPVKIAGQVAYRGDEGVTLWISDALAVVGTEDAVTAAIEAQGGETLDKNERFTTALKQVRADDPLAIGYTDLKNASALGAALTAMDDESKDAFKQLKKSGVPGASAGDLDALEQLANAPFPDADMTVAMAALAKPGQITLEFGGTQPKPATGSAEQFAKDGSDAVAALPSGSWLAFGSSLASANGMEGLSLADQLKQIEELTGEELPSGLTSALDKIKTLAVGIKGDSLLAIGGAAIVQTTDAAAATELLKTIERELAKDSSLTVEKTPIPGADDSLVVRTAQLPIRIAVGVKGDRLVIGLGAESVTNALEGAKTLSGDPAYKQAQEALGGDAPMMLVNPTPLAQLLGDLPSDGDMQEITGALQGIKLLTSSYVATGDTTWRGGFVLRYDAALLGQALNGGGSAGGTVTGAQPGR
jgi:hypothetical protein